MPSAPPSRNGTEATTPAEPIMRAEQDLAAPQPPADSRIAIGARGISKMYRIYDRPRDRLKQMLWGGRRSYGREFWALHDISFEIHKGESVGIIGRNGSGKSTLLQIIAGTLTPTTGEAYVQGRVTALLELGSGFNPEFTGRENVFLNGAILGAGQAEMEQRFDLIAAFADIGAFIEQPVKTYSSGMLLRLAFAVQAHLQPDVLIVDEALSVGDIAFQHKCMRRIKDLIDQGTTLLFVSHAMDTVKRFCHRGLWLEGGRMRYFGESGVAAERYLAASRMRELQDWAADDRAHETSTAPDQLEDMLSLEGMLPYVDGPIDLTQARLFPRGGWEWASAADAPLPARRCTDPAAPAGFRCQGEQIELTFVSGPRAGAVRVTVDGAEYFRDLFHPSETRNERVRLEVRPGEHTVLIAPVPYGHRRETALCWLGGRVHAAPHLTFRRDPDFGGGGGAVERYGSGKARLTAVELLDYRSEQPVAAVRFGQRVRLRLHAERLAPAVPRLEFSFIVRDRNRIDLFGTTTTDEQINIDPAAERFVIEFAFDIRLGPGSYSILAAFVECSEDLSFRAPMDQVDIAAVFSVAFDTTRPVWYVFDEPMTVTAALE